LLVQIVVENFLLHSTPLVYFRHSIEGLHAHECNFVDNETLKVEVSLVKSCLAICDQGLSIENQSD